MKRVCIKANESILVLVLDRLLQAIDRLRLCNFDGKYTLWIIADDPTIEMEYIRHIV
jgi:hypothetical protein